MKTVFCCVALFCLAEIAQAYPEYGVPTMDPHFLGDIKVTQGNKQVGLNYTASDVLFYGLSTLEIKKVDFNQRKREFNLWYFNKKFVQLNKYVAKGKILLFPINGHGKSNITILNSNVHITLKYDIVPDTKTNVKYVKVKSLDYRAKPGKAFMNFENLFNGDKYLSKQINDVINMNSDDLLPSFSPGVEKAIAQAWMGLASDFFSKISYDELFIQE
uniref:Protein takeout n=1 Tax=Cacopsylla melanoneura TaxID=428564 RepID=A0A8D8YU74_9HEMI